MRHQAEPAPSSGGGRRRTAQKEKKPGLSGWRKELWDWSRALVVAVVIVLLLKAYVFQLSTVKKISMQPTLHENEWLFVNKIVLKLGNLDRGDVVILKDPSGGSEDKQFLVKRIVGIPGDTLEIRDGELYINGELKVESYTDVKIEDGDYPLTTVSPGHYFVMGDNRHHSASKDSRAFKEVPEELIKGRADLIVWPISRWAKL
ncbi:signal peptidase I [Cohnella mopanensis]|uniref:signal peptidase I n=1 Tax=Cohnella mopanensis TaxID=2911966 RepID=UPI001EF7D88E|nr:signal peptidase I [Cohnella mopanensis]